MDRYVIRTPTWKTLNYSSMAAQSLAQRKSIAKRADGDNKKKPLRQKQLNEISEDNYDFRKRLGEFLPSAHHNANAENFNANSNDSGLSSASSVSPQQIDDNAPSPNYLATAKNYMGNLEDYIDSPVGKENDRYTSITHTPKSNKKVVESDLQVQKTLEGKKLFDPEVNETPEKFVLKANNMIMARIQRDLNSPSAAARMKAIKAMKSPTKSAYNQFDVPEDEQSFQLPEPPSLQEIMRNIVVYVEVRSGEDNRSAGVRKVIEALGARVSLGLNRETTHVIFKDGLLSTFKKATQMNIPIVSILWIEACKNQRRICDPKNFPISNLDRYENPELYTKMKRVKSMQPDSECNKRIRAKAGGGTPKDSTPTQKTGNKKKTSTFIGGTPTSSITKKKTDISQFFKKIASPAQSTAATEDYCNNGATAATPTIESPASKLLNCMHSECYTPLNESKNKTSTQEINNSEIYSAEKVVANVKASIKSDVVVGIETASEASPNLPQTRGRQRRHSLMANCELETATNCMSSMLISVSTPRKSNRRRSSIHATTDMSLATTTSTTNATNIQTIQEENDEMEVEQPEPPKSNVRRRTLYAPQKMDQLNLMDFETNKKVKTPTTSKANRRRTLYNTEKMVETSELVKRNLSNFSIRRRTCFNLKSLKETENPETTQSEPEVNRKIINVTNDIEMTSTTPSAAKKSSINYRTTLYAAKTMRESNIAATITANVTASSNICITPTNFQKGRIFSSTLLDNNEYGSKLLETPPADVTAGKLLEETEQCATPLIFRSARQPGNKRRTMFDVSMDIITQRLQCINQSARRSLVPPTPSAEVAEAPIITPINIKKKTNSHSTTNITTPKSSTESLAESIDNHEGACSNSSKSVTLQKRRKLFMPNEMPVTPTPTPAPQTVPSANRALKTIEETNKLATHSSSITASNADNFVTKRRRTLMPISQPQPTTATTTLNEKDCISNKIVTPTVRKRRSTLDFEQMRQTKDTTSSAKGSSSAKKNPTQQQFKPKRPPVLVYTNMHQQQIDAIREALDKLRLFTLENCVTKNTTHLVSLEPRRTLNLLKALARGLWILDYCWIADSVKAGKWLPEEFYELKDFSKAIKICRSERQAFGSNYKCDLFRKFGAFYISSNCSPISKENMSELITLCGGHVVNARQKARFIIGDANRTLEDKLYLTPFWVVDSITQMKLMKVNKYLYPLATEGSASQPQPSLDCKT